MNIGPDHFVGFIPFPLAEKSLDEIHDGQNAQKQTREKRHESGLGGMKGPEAKLEASEANDKGKGDPNQIVDEICFFHRAKFSSNSFIWSGKENTSTGHKLQEEKRNKNGKRGTEIEISKSPNN